MKTEIVTSKDGTSIAFERCGSGPALILVDGAMCCRGLGQSRELAALLASEFTVYTYDRRGRGESGDTAPYSVTREVEDLEALVAHAGGSASLWGMSSGARLALEAAAHLSGIRKLALYEAPFIVDASRPPIGDSWTQISAALGNGRRSDAVRLFLKAVGVPAFFVALMPLMPTWRKLKAIAHTLPYDAALVEPFQQGKPLPADRWSTVRIPALVTSGGSSPAWMQAGNQALAAVLPNAEHRTLPKQNHMLQPKVLAPTLAAFFR